MGFLVEERERERKKEENEKEKRKDNFSQHSNVYTLKLYILEF